MILPRLVRAYLSQSRRIWNYLPASLRLQSLGQAYGKHLHGLVSRYAKRGQNHSTFFLRNRAELELMRRLVDQKAHGSSLNISVVACSNGAEVYSILWTIRSARPDLKLSTHAIDISQEILDFAITGVYSRGTDVVKTANGDVALNIFERVAADEMEAMFEVEGGRASVRPWLKEGIAWLRGDATDPELAGVLGPQDIVVANRFLCHMGPAIAEKCLRNVARLVKPGGYLFISGVDLDVRTRVAREMGWKPVTDLMRELHEGDPSLRSAWPLEYWGAEPFREGPDCRIRYASAFQIGEVPGGRHCEKPLALTVNHRTRA